MVKQIDPLIHLLKNRLDVLQLLGRIWDILYIEGNAPDIGKRRENVVKELLRKELGLTVKSAPATERGWDLSVIIEGEERRYSLKTSEDISVMKVAWNGYPSLDRARQYKFTYPILYVTRDKRKSRISIYVFELEDLEELREELGDTIWWIPKQGTNPRGFGIRAEAIRKLINRAEEKGNFAAANYTPINVDSIRDEYWNGWYNLLKSLALRG
ncbi:MAG: ThaI family type II restriction endonuclease [Caldivirga sp.]